jgi:hypothetical protein
MADQGEEDRKTVVSRECKSDIAAEKGAKLSVLEVNFLLVAC